MLASGNVFLAAAPALIVEAEKRATRWPQISRSGIDDDLQVPLPGSSRPMRSISDRERKPNRSGRGGGSTDVVVVMELLNRVQELNAQSLRLIALPVQCSASAHHPVGGGEQGRLIAIGGSNAGAAVRAAGRRG